MSLEVDWGDRSEYDEVDQQQMPGLPDVNGLTGLARGVSVTGQQVLETLRSWLARFIRTSSDDDLDTLALWIAHTHFIHALRTTPRLLIDSVTPEAGKTTVLEHIEALGYKPLKAAAIGSPALLARAVKDAPSRCSLTRWTGT